MSEFSRQIDDLTKTATAANDTIALETLDGLTVSLHKQKRDTRKRLDNLYESIGIIPGMIDSCAKNIQVEAPVFAGKWDVVAETDQSNMEHAMIVKKSGSGFSALASTDDGEIDYTSLKVLKNGLKMEIPFGGGTVKIAAKLSAAQKLVGEWKYYDDFNEEVAKGNWSATKAKQ